MRITFDEEDAILVARSLAKSRGVEIDFEQPYPPDSLADKIHTEALRVIAAFRTKYGAVGAPSFVN